MRRWGGCRWVWSICRSIERWIVREGGEGGIGDEVTVGGEWSLARGIGCVLFFLGDSTLMFAAGP